MFAKGPPRNNLEQVLCHDMHVYKRIASSCFVAGPKPVAGGKPVDQREAQQLRSGEPGSGLAATSNSFISSRPG